LPFRSHDHAYFLPTDEDGDGRIDHVTIFARGKFSRDDVAALDKLRSLTFGEAIREGVPTHRLLLTGLGTPESVRCPVFESSSTWVSATPFLVTRHLKARGQKRDPREWLNDRDKSDFIAAVATEELQRTDFAKANPTVSVIPGPEVMNMLRWRYRPLQFRRGRSKRGDNGFGREFGACRITFDKPVPGPICIGHSSHFGLGLFVPES
jgi:CRISPR-associated protein Csb2